MERPGGCRLQERNKVIQEPYLTQENDRHGVAQDHKHSRDERAIRPGGHRDEVLRYSSTVSVRKKVFYSSNQVQVFEKHTVAKTFYVLPLLAHESGGALWS